jgi:hypothetical protein
MKSPSDETNHYCFVHVYLLESFKLPGTATPLHCGYEPLSGNPGPAFGALGSGVPFSTQPPTPCLGSNVFSASPEKCQVVFHNGTGMDPVQVLGIEIISPVFGSLPADARMTRQEERGQTPLMPPCAPRRARRRPAVALVTSFSANTI